MYTVRKLTPAEKKAIVKLAMEEFLSYSAEEAHPDASEWCIAGLWRHMLQKIALEMYGVVVGCPRYIEGFEFDCPDDCDVACPPNMELNDMELDRWFGEVNEEDFE